MSPLYLSRSSPHSLAGLPCRLFLSYGIQVVTRVVHRSSLRRLICPAQDHFIFLTLLIISMTFVFSLTQMLVFLSLYVMLSILLSILVCAATHLFCACLVSVQVSAPCHSWQHTVVHLSLGKVAFEDIPMFGVCRPACHDSSLYLFVLVLFSSGEIYRWSRAQTIQVWTGIFFRTMIKTIKHIGHKTSISVGRLDAAQNVQLSRRGA